MPTPETLTAEKKEKLVLGAKSSNNLVKTSSIEKLKAAGFDANGNELKKSPPKPASPAPKPVVKKAEPKPTPAPAKKVEKSKRAKPTKEEIEECEELLQEHVNKAKTTKKWKKQRADKGLPEKKTAPEVLKKANEKVSETVKTALEKGKALSKQYLNQIRSNIKHIVKETLVGIPEKKDKKEFINELIAELKKQL